MSRPGRIAEMGEEAANVVVRHGAASGLLQMLTEKQVTMRGRQCTSTWHFPNFENPLVVMQAGQSDGVHRGVQRCALRSISVCSRRSVVRQALLSAGANEALQVKSSLLKWLLLQRTTTTWMAEWDWVACAGTADACRSVPGTAGTDSRYPSAAPMRLSMGSSGHQALMLCL